MNARIDPTTLHRTAKYFMDTGRAESHEAALGILQRFGLSIIVDPAVAATANGQIALLTLVNIARRTFLSGVEVSGVPNIPCAVSLTKKEDLRGAVVELGGKCVDEPNEVWPVALVGPATAAFTAPTVPTFGLHWAGWSGGIIPGHQSDTRTEDSAMPLAPCLAAAICAAEVFAYHASDHPLAGKRAVGLSLWNPTTDWLHPNFAGPKLSCLPSRLWLIGLGNLGQAYAWALACLPYQDAAEASFILQDFDRIEPSNDSTSVLSTLDAVGRKKARHVAEWLEQRGFGTSIIEQRFTADTRPVGDDPRVALCGVDNPLARSALEHAGFGLIVEAGLGAGPAGFRGLAMHTFPSSISAHRLWSASPAAALPDASLMPAYETLRQSGVNQCGLVQLASRTIGVPFVGLTAGLFVVSELLRRLHGGEAYQVLSGSTLSLADLESVGMTAEPYAFGYVSAAN